MAGTNGRRCQAGRAVRIGPQAGSGADGFERLADRQPGHCQLPAAPKGGTTICASCTDDEPPPPRWVEIASAFRIPDGLRGLERERGGAWRQEEERPGDANTCGASNITTASPCLSHPNSMRLPELPLIARFKRQQTARMARSRRTGGAAAPAHPTRALAAQEARSAAIAEGTRRAHLVARHPPVYAGTSATAPVLDPRFEVGRDRRGGRYTYQVGQQVGYACSTWRTGRRAPVRPRTRGLGDRHAGDIGVEAWAVPERIGIWTRDIDGSEAKIGAIGVRVRKWVTMHGFAVNLDPDLTHFAGIVPCGVSEYGVTSLARLGLAVGPEEWDGALRVGAGDFLAALEAPELE